MRPQPSCSVQADQLEYAAQGEMRPCLAAMVFMARTSTPWRLLPAAAGAVGPGLGAVLRVRAAGVCPGLLQAAIASSKGNPRLLGPGYPDRLVLQADLSVAGGVGPTRAAGSRAAGGRPARRSTGRHRAANGSPARASLAGRSRSRCRFPRW